MITSLALSPALDVTYVVRDLAEGRTFRPASVHRHPGGKAVNMARAAVDTHGSALVAAIVTRPAVTKVNRAEANELCGAPSDAALSEVALEVHDRSGGLVVITDSVADVAVVVDRCTWQLSVPPLTGRFAAPRGRSPLPEPGSRPWSWKQGRLKGLDIVRIDRIGSRPTDGRMAAPA